VYWQGVITGNTSHALVMSVRVSGVAGLITSTGTATTDGQLILADTAKSQVIAAHRVQLPTVMR
jgi:hypothetical protein